MEIEQKVKLAFFLPKQMQIELQERLMSDGCGRRKKSNWIREAISRFMDLSNKLDLIYLAHNMDGLGCKETITVPHALKVILDRLTIEVKRKLFFIITSLFF